jgi:hypothetical protein
MKQAQQNSMDEKESNFSSGSNFNSLKCYEGNLKMKYLLLTLLLSLFVFNMPVQGADSPAFDSRDFKTSLHMADKRKQQLIFAPAEPGAVTGTRRIIFDGGSNMAELLIQSMPVPEFKQKLRVELEILCEEGTTLLSADLRLRDAKGEICCASSDRGNRYTGKIKAVWIITAGQNFKMAWGANCDHKLDLPAAIDNIGFSIQGNTGEITLQNFKITVEE